jgi:predicted nucleic acid-binding Zn ribbon protein
VTWHPNSDEGDGPHRLREAIDGFLTRGGHREITVLSKVLEVWVDTVGEHVAKHVKPTAIAQGTLLVDVDEAGWSTEVTFLAGRILTNLEQRLGEPVATQVKARVRGGSSVE